MTSSTLHLISPSNDQQPQEAQPTAVQNLLDHFNLMNVYEAFAQSSAKTFKSYIRHLPGDFHVSKQGRVDPAGSLKKVLENAPPPEDIQPIHFRPIPDRLLQAAFTLQDGGYKKKKRSKKRDKENGTTTTTTPTPTGTTTQNGGSDKHKKKKRHSKEGDGESEPKKKKKKKDKEKEKENNRTIPAPPPTTIKIPVQQQFSIIPQNAGHVRR